MSQLTDQTERQAYNAIMAARAGSPDALSSQLERQIYAALVAAGTGGGGGGGGGTPGQAATVTVGTTTTLPPGSQATVTNSGTTSAAVLNFGVPQGEKGEQGQQGIQGPAGPTGPAGADGENAVAALTPRGDYSESASPTYVVNDYISYNGNSYACKADNPTNVAPTTGGSDDPFWQLMALQGAKGTPGKAATVSVGTTTTLPAGSQATVTNSGTTSDAVLNFGIPQGQQGIQGPAGPTGPAGADGENAVAALTPRGDYSESASPTYVVNDYISYNGNSYACKADNPTNVAPTTGGSDDPFWQLMALQGAKGTPGKAATVSVGTTTTLPAGSQATVTNVGTSSAAILNFGIPQGQPGISGGSASNNFSLAEQAWGTWIDGKTIYRKIFTDIPYNSKGAFSNGSIDISDLNIEKVLCIEGTRVVNATGNTFANPTSIYVYVAGNKSLQGALDGGTSSVSVGIYNFISIYYTKAD